MLEIIIRNTIAVVDQTERLLDSLARHVRAGRLDDAHDLHHEVERLTDVALLLDEAARMLRRTFEVRPEIARGFVHATLQ
jgi:hypothetical protein